MLNSTAEICILSCCYQATLLRDKVRVHSVHELLITLLQAALILNCTAHELRDKSRAVEHSLVKE